MTSMIPFNRVNKRIVPFEINNINSVLDDFFSDMWSPKLDYSTDTFKMDVQDMEESFVIEAEMPGIQKDEINLEMEENTLRIEVKREELKEENEKNYVHKERKFISMSRKIYLRDVKEDEIDAKLENGVLTITVPKVERTERVKQIDIN